MRGKQIKTAEELYQTKSVYVKNWKKGHSTAFICSMQFRIVMRWIKEGQFFYFIKDKTEKSRNTNFSKKSHK